MHSPVHVGKNKSEEILLCQRQSRPTLSFPTKRRGPVALHLLDSQVDSHVCWFCCCCCCFSNHPLTKIICVAAFPNCDSVVLGCSPQCFVLRLAFSSTHFPQWCHPRSLCLFIFLRKKNSRKPHRCTFSLAACGFQPGNCGRSNGPPHGSRRVAERISVGLQFALHFGNSVDSATAVCS